MKLMLKILGSREATGLWLGARPNLEPHFHMRVSLRHVYSCLSSPELYQEGPAPQVRGREAGAGCGRWAACLWLGEQVPIRVNYRARPQREVRKQGRVNDVGEIYMWDCPHMAVWL